ncbi:uncharacterized protein LOC121728151 [Aricia agestis]|uniref:uncharacterized protein LOC121728151 n=1 Tax=Aricia agestis TaxID=91739 RepID=UPI001C20829D|nr:uncharacterized protein LOC121728151 [Aricia agestis]
MPHKQPSSLFKICVQNSLQLINEFCYFIEKNYPVTEVYDCQRHVYDLKQYLMSTLPSGLFDVLCMSRSCCPYGGDPRVQLRVLTHPQMSVFRKIDVDNCIPKVFWIHMFPMLNRLVVLDLKFICTDEILETIAKSCPLLEELNIVSKVEIRKSLINASVIVRNVSDVGLNYLTTLKRLRILSMDPPRNEKSNRVVRGVSQTGIIMLIRELPYLEELRIESCDIGSTLIGSQVEIGPLNLRKVNCHYISAESIQKLVKICPNLKELAITHLSTHDKDDVLEAISASNLQLSRLDMLFFSYSPSLDRLLKVQGQYLTHFSLWEIDDCMTIETIINLGVSCPNITNICLLTQSSSLSIPHLYKKPNIFNKLQTLTVGSDNFNLEKVLTFFLEAAQNLQKLTVKYQSKTQFDATLKLILSKGYLRNIKSLWLDCTLEVSKEVIKQIIQSCCNLTDLTVDFNEDMKDVHEYISNNNLDLKLGGY